jgi:hypothetical protein
MPSVGIPSENRCYVQLSVYEYPLTGITDTGANKSYLGRKGFRLCQSLDIPIDQFLKPQPVQLADKSTVEIVGSIVTHTVTGKDSFPYVLHSPQSLCRYDYWFRLLVQAGFST